MSTPVQERSRKRPRPSDPPSPTPTDPSAVHAVHATLQAALSAGTALPTAVQALLRLPLHPDDNPVLSALRNAPALQSDLLAVSRLIHAVQLALASSTSPTPPPPPREQLPLPLSALSDVARLISNASRIVVLTGAGVSVSCGIPDFRSKGGLYDVAKRTHNLPDPQAIFDLDEFKLDPTLFYSFARHVMPSPNLRPSPTHAFVAELSARGKLLRNYTQNIDGLEHRAGVPDTSLVLCHGSFLTATCMRRTCRAKVPGATIAAEVASGSVPLCRICVSANDDEDEDDEIQGVLKPDIVFFGESLPRTVTDCLRSDVDKGDLLLVLGTSLQVAPVARIPHYFRDDVPRVLVNRELVGYDFDVELLGDCDIVVAALRHALGWDRPSEIPEPASPAAPVFQPPRRFVFSGAMDCIKEDGKEGLVAPEREDVAHVVVGEAGNGGGIYGGQADVGQIEEEKKNDLDVVNGHAAEIERMKGSWAGESLNGVCLADETGKGFAGSVEVRNSVGCEANGVFGVAAQPKFDSGNRCTDRTNGVSSVAAVAVAKAEERNE